MIGSMIWKKFPRTRPALWMMSIAIVAVVSCGKPIADSVVIRDTVIITQERVLVDTLELMRDTIIYKDRIRLEVEYLDRFVKVGVECPSDTVRVETIKVVNQIEKPKRGIGWQGLLGWSLAILCLLVMFRELVRELVKRF